MKKIIILSILICFVCISAFSQTFTLQGRVTDSNNNPVELATVAVVKQGRVTLTNLKGEFSLHLNSADSVVVRFSYNSSTTTTNWAR